MVQNRLQIGGVVARVALVLALGVALALWMGATASAGAAGPGDEPTFAGWIFYSIETFVLMVPIGAGVLVALLGYRLRDSVLVALAAITLGVAADFSPPSLKLDRQEVIVLYRDPGTISLKTDWSRWQAAGAVGWIWDQLHGRMPEADEVLRDYPRDHARPIIARAYKKVFYLLFAPLLAVGIVGGVLTWVDRNVIFRRPNAELILRNVLAFTLSPVVCWICRDQSERTMAGIFFRGDSFFLAGRPYIALMLLAAVGWWSIALTGEPEIRSFGRGE